MKREQSLQVFRELVHSSATVETPSSSLDQFFAWWRRLDETYSFDVTRIPFAEMAGWHFDERGWIAHQSGKFFSVRGVEVLTNFGTRATWSQPIIVQPEIGILGIVSQVREGVLHFLMQAKMEPGNVNKLQLSPTVQATRSNYTRVHGGALPPYLELFTTVDHGAVIVDQLQSEQGARFFRKRNRNIVIRIAEDTTLPVLENFMWLTLGQIRSLLKHDNLVNMNTRSVLSCLQPGRDADRAQLRAALESAPRSASWGTFEDEMGAAHLGSEGFSSTEEIISWYARLKFEYELEVNPCRLDQLAEWRVGPDSVSHVDGKYFDVIAVRAKVDQREVRSWCQPMIRQREPGIVGFVLRKIDGRYHVLVQAKMEVGNFDVLEMAPTVQCLTGSYQRPEYQVPFLDLFLERRGTVRFDVRLSEEGGRFFQEENRYMVLEVGQDFPVEVPPRFTWMTLRQAKDFIQYNNYFNVEARSLLACVSPL